MKDPQQIDWNKEFSKFMSADDVAPPLHVTHALFKEVRRELSPSAVQVFGKLALSGSIAGAISLFFCPQFGISFMRHSGLQEVFMNLGQHGCSIACGLFFSLVSFGVAMSILRPEELRVIRANEALFISVMSGLFLGLFSCFGSPVLVATTVLWLIGSILGGVIAVEFAARTQLRHA